VYYEEEGQKPPKEERVRLFVAILFPAEAVDHLIDVQTRLKVNALQGSFPPRENIHLTIAFLGEVESQKVHTIREAMRKVSIASFSLLLTDVGSFKTSEGRLYWMGVKKNDQLDTLYDELTQSLAHGNVRFDDKEFKPHVTLGREVVLKDDFDLVKFNLALSSMRVDVEKIALMRSDRINGVIQYREVASRHLP
jgi:2'-5' RNA ligase